MIMSFNSMYFINTEYISKSIFMPEPAFGFDYETIYSSISDEGSAIIFSTSFLGLEDIFIYHKQIFIVIFLHKSITY